MKDREGFLVSEGLRLAIVENGMTQGLWEELKRVAACQEFVLEDPMYKCLNVLCGEEWDYYTTISEERLGGYFVPSYANHRPRRHCPLCGFYCMRVSSEGWSEW